MERTKQVAALIGVPIAVILAIIVWVKLCSLPFGTQTLAFPLLAFGIPIASAFGVAIWRDLRS